ncbi:MAG: hypothetical protein M0Q92_02135 [Methanoregula sp.]|jgi:hypothetical protein|nr:hypothetical protein [Methanoregula sp.]
MIWHQQENKLSEEQKKPTCQPAGTDGTTINLLRALSEDEQEVHCPSGISQRGGFVCSVYRTIRQLEKPQKE